MPKQFINAHTRLREPTLLEKLSDLAAKLKKVSSSRAHPRLPFLLLSSSTRSESSPPPFLFTSSQKLAPIPTPRRHPFYEDTKHCEIPFASPPSSLPPRTLQQTAALLALLPSLQTAFEANNERVYSKLLRKLFKLDPEVCVDFELAVLTAKEADLGDAYFRFVRKGLDERSVWQGQGVFSWLGFCSYTVRFRFWKLLRRFFSFRRRVSLSLTSSFPLPSSSSLELPDHRNAQNAHPNWGRFPAPAAKPIPLGLPRNHD